MKRRAPCPQALEAVLRRNDVWRGHSQVFVSQSSVDTGFVDLNAALVHQGWPQSCLIEVGQRHVAATWFLFAEAAIQLTKRSNSSGMLALLNPPAEPNAVSLLQHSLPLERVMVVRAAKKQDFLSCFVELARSPVCSMLMAWQPKEKLSYAELRKCQLAAHKQVGLYVLFRHRSALQQSSPAALRIDLQLQAAHMSLLLKKQKGRLTEQQIRLDLPELWFPCQAYKDLLQEPGLAAPSQPREGLPSKVRALSLVRGQTRFR